MLIQREGGFQCLGKSIYNQRSILNHDNLITWHEEVKLQSGQIDHMTMKRPSLNQDNLITWQWYVVIFSSCESIFWRSEKWLAHICIVGCTPSPGGVVNILGCGYCTILENWQLCYSNKCVHSVTFYNWPLIRSIYLDIIKRV